MDILRLQSLSFGYEDKTIIKDLTLHFKSNRFEAILGESGIGKTTLINLILGRLKPTGGEITKNFKKIGFVSQYDSLIENISVLKNIEYVSGDKDSSIEALKLVGLSNVAPLKARVLSKGMKKRVEIARALSINPDLIIMDEPFGNLDYFTKLNLVAGLKHFIKRINATFIYITHDIDEALIISDNITIFNTKPLQNNYMRLEGVDLLDKKSTKEEILKFISKGQIKLTPEV